METRITTSNAECTLKMDRAIRWRRSSRIYKYQRVLQRSQKNKIQNRMTPGKKQLGLGTLRMLLVVRTTLTMILMQIKQSAKTIVLASIQGTSQQLAIKALNGSSPMILFPSTTIATPRALIS